MTFSQHTELSPRPDPIRIYQTGGHGYNIARNTNASRHIIDTYPEGEYEVLPSLPDPERHQLKDTSYEITLDGIRRQVPAIKAMRHLGKSGLEASISKYHSKRADQLIEHITANADGPITGMFVSADNLNGLQAAHQRPELFKNLWMINPAGIAAPLPILKASIGVARAGARSWAARKRATPGTNFEAGKDIRPPKGREASVVAPSVALSYQKHLLTELRAEENTPNVGISLALGDPMMDPKRIISNLQPGDVDLLFITNGIHGIGGDKRTMDDHLKRIPDLEAAGEKRRAGQAPKTLREKIVFADDVPNKKKTAILKLVDAIDKASNEARQNAD